MVTITDSSLISMHKGINVAVRELRRASRDRGMLYRAIRKLLRLSQGEMAEHLGCSRDAIVNREHKKRVYSLAELNALQKASGLSDVEWCELLRQIAK
jgi:transcriptional regulator with XRE-family HTH domain